MLLRQQLHRHLVLLVPFLVGGNRILARDHEPDGVRHVSRSHAQIRGALAIDLDLKLRAVEADARIHVQQARDIAGPRRDLLRDLRPLHEIRAEDQRAYREEGFSAAES